MTDEDRKSQLGIEPMTPEEIEEAKPKPDTQSPPPIPPNEPKLPETNPDE